ncbi:MAG: VOC family protein [Thaumarchaeota archaeon]|nr:VOC family protein [Nitrososphaerota archaeon]
MNTNRIAYISLHVKDLNASERFYRDLVGLPLYQDEPSHYELTWKDPYLHFAIFGMKDGEVQSHSEIGFLVDDLDGIHKKMVLSGVHVIEKPTQQPWGYNAAYLDPDGNTVNLTVLAENSNL